MCASIFGFLVGALVFHVDFSNVNLGLAIVTVLCAMISASCFGLFLAVFGLMSDSMHLVLNVVSYLLMIFTGAEFPVSQLPLAGRIVAQFMPLTKSISEELWERFAVSGYPFRMADSGWTDCSWRVG